ncbi:tetratricopeptide repeat protein [Chlorogloeopsis sp. ULAP02]|uniref:tetratricopeptide repeat protein n=1 Tax=Chlorogloeopsis sp. ULAP02 TaxID=3107926 RepID=UPI00313544B1
MDWINVLRSLQSDFIKRLTSGCLLHCEIEGQYSELTIISGERLRVLREFCWQMAEKYKRVLPVRDVFLNYLKGKLGEEVVKERLADLITEVDYEKRFGGDGNIDFTLTADSSIGVEVKSRCGSIDRVRWSISSEEVEKNAVVVCVLIEEEVNEAQPEYHLFLAGFLPTQMIKLKTGRISFGIEQLLYGGGLQCYLEQLQSSINYNLYKEKNLFTDKNKTRQELVSKSPLKNFIKSSSYPIANEYLREQGEDLNRIYTKLGDECCNKEQYEAAISHYNEALQLNPNHAETYYKRGLARYQLGDYEGAIPDYTQAIMINPNYMKAYKESALARYQLGDYEGAIADYTQAIRINPHSADIYRNRADVRYFIGDHQGAIEDYTQARKIYPHDDSTNSQNHNSYSPIGNYQGVVEVFDETEILCNDSDAYKKRGNFRAHLGDYEGAIADYTQAININSKDADAYFNRGNALYNLGNKQAAIENFRQAAEIYRREGNLAGQKKAREIILDLEIEESLDILKF